MSSIQTRRDWMKLVSLGGVVFASSLAACAAPGANERMPAKSPNETKKADPVEDFFFLQLSDTHWGFEGAANPEASTTLARTVDAINASSLVPDFVVFTGDLTHNSDDPKERRRRMAEFKKIVSGLKVQSVRFLPGEHDAGADRGEAYREYFGDLHYSFDHKGIHFVALDNVSDAAGTVGDAQLAWLQDDLAKTHPDTPVVVFAHRPLFDLYPQWGWSTADGARVVESLSRRARVTVFYGHIHQEHHRTTGNVTHHSAKSLMFALPAPGSAPKRAPIPWDPSRPAAGLGYRAVETRMADPYGMTEISIERKA